MKPKQMWIIISAVIIVVTLAFWQMTPRNFDRIIGRKYNFNRLAATAISSTIREGKPMMESYVIKEEKDSEKINEVLQILRSSRYQSSFRNLLSLNIQDYNSSTEETKWVDLLLQEDALLVRINLYHDDYAVISIGEKQGVYHATDPNLVYILYDFVKANGKE